MMLAVGSLFSGIGGIDKGLQDAGMEIKWQCEKDPWCRKILTKHWPEVPKYEDITTLEPQTVEYVDVLAGGFPCQDLSVAGKRAGLREGTRSGLWLEFARLIRGIRPKYVLVENVPGLLANHALGRVLGDLAESGYDALWAVVPGCAVGSTHSRERVFLVAHPFSARLQRGLLLREKAKFSAYGNFRENSPWNSSREQDELKSALVGVPHGVPHRVDRLRGLGNAVVPQIVEFIGKRIITAHFNREDEHG